MSSCAMSTPRVMSIATPETEPALAPTKAYAKGEESTDDQASIRGGEDSTDEGSSNSDGDSSQFTRKRTSPLSSESPSRRGSNASSTVPENISELLPSAGSVGHFAGECSRCCFFPKGRCSNGKDCTFCHFEHDRRPRRSKRGGSKTKVEEENATTASDSSVEAEAKTVAPSEPAVTEPAAPAPVIVKPPGLLIPVASSNPMVLPPPLPAFTGPMPMAMPSARLQYIPTPMGYNSARFCPTPANLQAHEGQEEAAKIRQISGGKPVKVWLPENVCNNKQLELTIPAKKRPPYPELLTAARPTLDPSQPLKKRVPVFSEGFLEGLFTQPLEFASVVPAVIVPSVPAVLVPR